MAEIFPILARGQPMSIETVLDGHGFLTGGGVIDSSPAGAIYRPCPAGPRSRAENPNPKWDDAARASDETVSKNQRESGPPTEKCPKVSHSVQFFKQRVSMRDISRGKGDTQGDICIVASLGWKFHIPGQNRTDPVTDVLSAPRRGSHRCPSNA